MKQDQERIDPASPTAADQSSQHEACRRHDRPAAHQRRGSDKPELKMTSLIDVVFLLLIFFVVTANFTIDEGSLLATMPGSTTGPNHRVPPPTPVQIDLASSDDGVTYRLTVDGVVIEGASALSALMADRVATGRMAQDDLVRITPQGVVRWQHVLNVYNACVSAELEQIAFVY